MKSRYLIHLVLSCVIVTLFVSCRKVVEVSAPVNQLVTTSVFKDNSTATAALLNIYAQMLDFPANIHKETGLSSDELSNYATDQGTRDLYINGLAATDATSIPANWTQAYTNLYKINSIIENLQNPTEVDPKIKKQIVGEAFFMRAYFYFFLVNLYGNVPLITSTDYKTNSVMARTVADQVYQQIVLDLKQSQTLLSNNFVDATDTTVTTEHIRPTTWAATALLSRVYLYMGTGHYNDAETQATTVIQNSPFNLPSDLNKVFTKNSSEAIWQLALFSSLTWTTDGQNFIINATPGPASGKLFSISTGLYNAFEPGDARKSTWINTYSNGTGTWYYPFKYKNYSGSSSGNEYTMMLRLAEQYLIRAEARIQQGNISGGLADLNIIRSRAGLGNYLGARDQVSLLSAIAHERQVELFTEGDRWFDIKRTKTVDAIMGGSNGVCAAKGGNWNTSQQLYPIPPLDISNNSNLMQNSGY